MKNFSYINLREKRDITMKSKIRLQPLISLDSNSIFGYEALYQKQNVKEKYPSAFNILEKIYDNCAGNRDFRVFINMTARDLLSKQFEKKLSRFLKNNNINVVFEINENTNPKLFEQSIPMLVELQKLGVKIALDDFGVDYSIINFTKNIRFDFVKIDQSLVQQSVVNEHAMGLMCALVNIANNTGSEIIAEGIETAQQLKNVIKAGVKIGQGFLFSAQQSSSFVSLDEFYHYLLENEVAA